MDLGKILPRQNAESKSWLLWAVFDKDLEERELMKKTGP